MADPSRNDEEFRREASLEEVDAEVQGWLPLLPEVYLPPLTFAVPADVVRRKSATAGGLDGWRWRELKALSVPWFDGLVRSFYFR